jgi:hypothetical protein
MRKFDRYEDWEMNKSGKTNEDEKIVHPDYIKEINLTTFMSEYNCDVKLDMIAYLKSFTCIEESFGRNKTYTTWVRQ